MKPSTRGVLKCSGEDDVNGCQHPGYLHFPKGLTKEKE